jgi:hypothetical protein
MRILISRYLDPQKSTHKIWLEAESAGIKIHRSTIVIARGKGLDRTTVDNLIALRDICRQQSGNNQITIEDLISR